MVKVVSTKGFDGDEQLHGSDIFGWAVPPAEPTDEQLARRQEYAKQQQRRERAKSRAIISKALEHLAAKRDAIAASRTRIRKGGEQPECQ